MRAERAEGVDAQRHVQERSCRATGGAAVLSGALTISSGRSTGHDEPPGMTPSSWPVAEDAAAEVVDELAQREADGRLEHAGLLHVAADAEEARAAVVQVRAAR